jgi:H+/Cl- antiporter ClcA
VTPDLIAQLRAYTGEKERMQYADARRRHRDSMRLWILIVLFLALLGVFVAKLYYAQAVGFKDTCELSQHFDPALSFLAGALTTILGFYFRDRSTRG